MRRREFLTLLGGAAAAWPFAARAQQDARVRRVGVLMPYLASDQEVQSRLQVFRQGLSNLGWVEGRNVRLDVRFAGPGVAQQQGDARELIALAPEVILVQGTGATQTLQAATRTIPIVFIGLSDVVATGVVSNLARPEANLTGTMVYEHTMAGKWLSLLKDAAPRLARVTLLFNPESAPFASSYVRVAEEAGERLGVKIRAAGVRDGAEIEPVIAATGDGGGGGLIFLPGPFATVHSATTIMLAAKYRVPAIYTARFFSAGGGLMSYGVSPILVFRDGATYVDRILRGAKPGDLPVQFPTKFELVVNLKTAKALGLDVSQQLQFLADEVIE